MSIEAIIAADCNADRDPSTFGYPSCCVEAFEAKSGDRPSIHCFLPCATCLGRAPLDVLWQEIVGRRGFGCVNAFDHVVTHVHGEIQWTSGARTAPRRTGRS